eukprot:158376-Alexandrium_andersonii.AAC.1
MLSGSFPLRVSALSKAGRSGRAARHQQPLQVAGSLLCGCCVLAGFSRVRGRTLAVRAHRMLQPLASISLVVH